ncbi:processing peptidase subunit alpha [Seminavis robusta]|uniref:Processing peptidase subunit alpha n=1 Tax=Seminavis robusta TaxID=568900 RepID=A0A9N8ERL1_9STRA|nr:processing peptidase subunit alpha [Seminavis robusta]|eukprot:Sro1637_g287640.1 processing peptidase subunit alpha (585) ;mRNA; r:9937-11691
MSSIPATSLLRRRLHHSSTSNGIRRILSTPTRARASRSLSTFSSYEYPNRTEAPEVTRTIAKEVGDKVLERGSPLTPETVHARGADDDDRFDDLGRLSAQDRLATKSKLPPLNTTLSGATAIEPTAPAYIPVLSSHDKLKVPTTEITCLANGMRVVSQETYGQVSTVGVVADVGSRHEPQWGVAHLWELVAFGATQRHSSGLEIQELLQDWGGTRFVNTGREQSLVCIDILRPNVEKAVQLLQAVLLEPKFLPEEVEDAKRTMEFQSLDLPPELQMEEALQTAAYGLDQQLGKPHYCPMEHLSTLNADVLRNFWNHNVLAHPQDIVIGGAGIGHEQLVDLTLQYFGDWPSAAVDSKSAQQSVRTKPSLYRGGQCFLEKPSSDGFTRVALAFELDGWHSEDLVPTCVLQTLLGGGNSFSAGGPGKGMYSRLYRQVLNRYQWAESAEAFTSIHAESGLWGITGSSQPKHSRDVIHVLADHLARLSMELVTDEELDRARNMLKCNVLTQLESRLVLFEDLGRQVLTYGHREDMDTTCRKIDAVTKEDLQELARKAIQKPPTLAAVGEGLDKSNIPSQEEVARWFQGI